jgi:hypothetical protein
VKANHIERTGEIFVREIRHGLPSLSEERSHPNQWYNRAADLRASAGAAWYVMENDDAQKIAKSLGFGDGYSMGVACRPVYHMLCGLALEVIMKAVLRQKDVAVPEIHDLNDLASRIGLERNPHERALLKFYTSSIVWAGRCPTPRNCTDEGLRKFFGEASAVLQRPGPRLGNLKVLTASGATDWEHFHALWLRIAGQFEFQ